MVKQHNMFMVAAGTYEDGERNCKYASDVLVTLCEAMTLLNTCSDYPWSEISYAVDGVWYVVEVRKE